MIFSFVFSRRVISTQKRITDISEEIDLFDDMLATLVELLEEKGIISQEAWEKRLDKRIRETAQLKSFREL